MNEQGKAADNRHVYNILIGALICIAVGIIILGAQGANALRSSANGHGIRVSNHNCASHGHVHGFDCDHEIKHDRGRHNKGCDHHAAASEGAHAECEHAIHNNLDCDKQSDGTECAHNQTVAGESCGRCDHKSETDRID